MATALPMPREAPVIIATRPSRGREAGLSMEHGMLFSKTDNSMVGTGDGLFCKLRCKTSLCRVDPI